MEGFCGEARQEGVTVVQARSDKAADEDGSSLGGKGGMEKFEASPQTSSLKQNKKPMACDKLNLAKVTVNTFLLIYSCCYSWFFFVCFLYLDEYC